MATNYIGTNNYAKPASVFSRCTRILILNTKAAIRLEVVVAQVIEQWHSVWASRVQIQDGPRLFLVHNCFQSILTGCQDFSNRTAHTLPSSFLFPIIIDDCKIHHL